MPFLSRPAPTLYSPHLTTAHSQAWSGFGASKAPDPHADESRSRSGIYLLDRHPVVRECMQHALQQHGHTVVGGAADPTQCVADLLRLQPKVLVLDLDLGPRSGFEVLEEIRRRSMSVRSIVLTTVAHPRHFAEAMRLGATSFLLRLSSLLHLLEAIDAALRGERYLTPEAGDLALQALSLKTSVPTLDLLSARERQVVTLVVLGHSSTQIGELLHLSPKTVDSYRSRLMAKLGVPDVTGLVRLAIRMGLIDVDTP